MYVYFAWDIEIRGNGYEVKSYICWCAYNICCLQLHAKLNGNIQKHPKTTVYMCVCENFVLQSFPPSLRSSASFVSGQIASLIGTLKR